MRLVTSFHSKVLSVLVICLCAALVSAQVTVPQQVRDWQAAARTAMQQEDYDAAVESFSKIVAAYSGTFYTLNARRGIAAAHILKGDTEEAHNALNALLTEYADHPQTPQAAFSLVWPYRQQKQYQQAVSLCLRLIDRYPEHAVAPQMVQWLARTYLQMGDEQQAEFWTERLLTDYAGRDEVVVEVGELARYYHKQRGDHDKALELYLRLLREYPNHETALDIERHVIAIYLEMGAIETAGGRIDNLIAAYGNHPFLAEAINRIGNLFRQHKLYDDAVDLHEAALIISPGDAAVAMAAYAGIGQCTVRLGDDEAVDRYVDTMISQMGHLPEAARIVYLIGEEYFYVARELSGNNESKNEKAAYRRSIDVLDKTFDTAENIRYEALSHYTIGLAYWYLGENFDAAESFLLSLDKKPHRHNADAMLWMIADCYEKLKCAGEIEPADADAVILWAYETFFEDYPDSRMVGFAAWQLAQAHVQQGRPVTAAGYLYWLMDYEAEHGYRYTTPQTDIDDLLRRLGNRQGCGQ